MARVRYDRSFVAKYLLKFIHSEMATKICRNLLLSFEVTIFAVFSENLNFNIQFCVHSSGSLLNLLLKPLGHFVAWQNESMELQYILISNFLSIFIVKKLAFYFQTKCIFILLTLNFNTSVTIFITYSLFDNYSASNKPELPNYLFDNYTFLKVS